MLSFTALSLILNAFNNASKKGILSDDLKDDAQFLYQFILGVKAAYLLPEDRYYERVHAIMMQIHIKHYQQNLKGLKTKTDLEQLNTQLVADLEEIFNQNRSA